MGYKLREVKLGQRAAIEAMQVELFTADSGIDDLSSGQWYYVYDDESDTGEIAGFCGIRELYDEPRVAYLARSGVLAKHQGNGLQRRMIHARLRWARRRGIYCVVTDTTENPVSANNLIDCGFKMFTPYNPWALPNSIYWKRILW